MKSRHQKYKTNKIIKMTINLHIVCIFFINTAGLNLFILLFFAFYNCKNNSLAIEHEKYDFLCYIS